MRNICVCGDWWDDHVDVYKRRACEKCNCPDFVDVIKNALWRDDLDYRAGPTNLPDPMPYP